MIHSLDEALCSFDNCDRHARLKGMCRAHHRRVRGGSTSTTPIRGTSNARDSEGRKLCWKCDEWLPPARFARVKTGTDGLDTRCHRCRTLGRHGLTKKSFAVLLESQGGACANLMCGATTAGGRGEWHIDHDHSCCAKKFSCGKCIRGLLCQRCNIALGLLGDRREMLEGLVHYLDRPASIELDNVNGTNPQGETSE